MPSQSTWHEPGGRMSAVFSCNEWDPLEEVIVGTATGAQVPRMDKSLHCINYAQLSDTSKVVSGHHSFVRQRFRVHSGIGSRLRSTISVWRSIDGNRDSPRHRSSAAPPIQGRTRCAALCPTIRRFDPRPRSQPLSRHTTHRSIVRRSVVGRGEGRMTDRALRPAARRLRASADSRGAIRC